MKSTWGDGARVGGAAIAIAGSVPFVVQNYEALKSLPWQNLTYTTSPGLTAYGLGEIGNARREFKRYWEAGKKVPFSKFIEWGLKSAPILSFPLALVSGGNVAISEVLPAGACVAGYGMEYF